MKARFPEPFDYETDENALAEMDLLMGIITGIRNIRGEMNISPSKKVSILIDMAQQTERDVVNRNMEHIRTLARVDHIAIECGAAKPEASATAVFGENQVHVLLKGLMDFDEEKQRLKREISKVDKEIQASRKKLSNKGFMEKAPDEVKKKVAEKVETLSARREKLNQNLSFIEGIND